MVPCLDPGMHGYCHFLTYVISNSDMHVLFVFFFFFLNKIRNQDAVCYPFRFAFLVVLSAGGAIVDNHMSRLLDVILNENYSTLTRPVRSLTNVTRVIMSMSLHQILELVSHARYIIIISIFMKSRLMRCTIKICIQNRLKI